MRMSAWEATVTFCGVAVAMPQGQSWAPPSSSESQRTWEPFRSLPVSTLPAWRAGWVHRRPIGLGRGGAAVVLRAGESLCTGGRAAAVSRRDGGCNAERCTTERWRSNRRSTGGSASAGIGDADQTSPLGSGRSRSQVRRPVQPRARPGTADRGVRSGREQHRFPVFRRGRSGRCRCGNARFLNRAGLGS